MPVIVTRQWNFKTGIVTYILFWENPLNFNFKTKLSKVIYYIFGAKQAGNLI